MDQYLKYILPVYVLLYFLFLFVIRALSVRKQIGKSPVMIAFADDAHGLIARYFKWWMAILGVYVLLFSVFPVSYDYFLPMHYLEGNLLKVIGLVILGVSLMWTYAAQLNMRTSWRIGIDQEQKTDLVTTGIFHYSRNPIFLGMIAASVGLFMLTPNSITLILMVVGFVMIQIQVRLEEDFLYKMHGDLYLAYKSSVRRFI